MTISNPQAINAAASPEVQINDNFSALGSLFTYSHAPTLDGALVRGYSGGRWGGFAVSDVAHTFGASATTYVSVKRSDGSLDFSTSSTHYADATNYATVETVVTGASAITSVTDDRLGGSGVYGTGGGAPGSGTVTNTGGNLTANALVLGAGTVDTKVAAGIVSDGTSKLTLGVAGTSVGAVALSNATSGTVTLQPVTGALGTVTLSLPAATDTLVGKATTDTLTNKTLTNAVVGTQTALDNSTKAASTAYADSAVAVGKGITVTSKSADYTLVLGDANSIIYHPASDTTARTFTIPANGSVAYPVGTTATFDNRKAAGALTIAITTDTMELVGSAGSTGSRTVAPGGQATAVKVEPTVWRINGTLLT